MKAWQVVGLMAAVLAVKGAGSSSSGWIMRLLGLHDVFQLGRPCMVGGAACLGALALLLRWARPQRLLRSISMRRKPMPWAVLAAASMEENTRQPPRCRSTTSVPALPKRTKCRWNPEPMGVGTIIALENPPCRTPSWPLFPALSNPQSETSNRQFDCTLSGAENNQFGDLKRRIYKMIFNAAQGPRQSGVRATLRRPNRS